MKPSMPRKFMSLREKNSSHRRSKSSEPGHKNRPMTSDVFFSYFKGESSKQVAKPEDEKDKPPATIEQQIDEIVSRSEELHFQDISRDHIRFVLLARYSDGNVEKAIELLRLQKQAYSGIILPYNPNTQMVGAENRGNVTCYLDALLFAMFAKLEAFECMLKNDLVNDAQRNLAALIRLWVNMLRSGKLIRTDMTAQVQEALARCGWREARLLEQQDTSEAFAFITETLQLPLLTLQVDLFHQGKGDVDDHKVVYERLLNLAVPPDPEQKGVKLEDCLEDYFNTKVDVLRDSLEEKKTAERASSVTDNAIRLGSGVEQSDNDGQPEGSGQHGKQESKTVVDAPQENLGDHTTAVSQEDEIKTEEIEVAESRDGDPAPLQRRWSMLDPDSLVPEPPSATFSTEPPPPNARQRSASIIQRIVIEEEKPASSDSPSILQQFKRQGSTIIKAVTIPAWQFYRLIPWHAASNNEPVDDIEVARQFNQRPVVGICLKRYMMTPAGQPRRQNTYIDIPDSLRLPYFMMGDSARSKGTSELNSEYKLVLQSVVCHRGVSLHSGHYISFARVNPKLLTDNRRHDLDPPPDYEEEQWAKFDDLALGPRVTYVDDIKAALKEEMPYLLFYQIVPMVDVATSSSGSIGVARPPSYTDSTSHVGGDRPRVSLHADTTTERTDMGRQTTSASNASSGLFDPSSGWGGGSTTTTTTTTGRSSLRPSTDLERPPRISMDAVSNASSVVLSGGPSNSHYSLNGQSYAISMGDTPVITPAITPAITPEGGQSPSMAPVNAPSGADELTASQRFSRAAARLAGKTSSRSRPASQAGEGRISLTMSRLGGLMRPSKEPLRLSEEVQQQDSVFPVLVGTHMDSAAASSTLTAVSTAPATVATAQSTPASTAGLLQPVSSVVVTELAPLEVRPQSQQQPQPQSQPQQPTTSEAAAPADGSRHHLHYYHHHMRRNKSGSQTDSDKEKGKGKDVDSAVAATATTITAAANGASSSGTLQGHDAAVGAADGKEKEKPDKPRTKRGVPERECVVM